jgi:polysaccharide export outer membrane protein
VTAGRLAFTVLLAALAGCSAQHVADKVEPPAPAAPGEIASLNQEIAIAAGRKSNAPSDYRIGADDLLEVTLFDIEGKDGQPRTVSARVSQSGNVTLPLIGQMDVGGKTPVEAEGVLKERYKKFIHEPQIAVFVKEYRSYRVSVVGHVEKPGVFEVTGERTLLEVLAMAGGLNEKAGKTLQISRRGEDKLETLFVDLDRLAEDGDMKLNLTMQPGDVVNVPKAGVVYVQGSVKKPGSYRLRDAMTLTQAIGAAGGPDEKLSNSDGVRLFRRGEKGGREEVDVDMTAINQGKTQDIKLVENDIVVVPMSLTKYVVDRFIGGVGMGLSIPVF